MTIIIKTIIVIIITAKIGHQSFHILQSCTKQTRGGGGYSVLILIVLCPVFKKQLISKFDAPKFGEVA